MRLSVLGLLGLCLSLASACMDTTADNFDNRPNEETPCYAVPDAKCIEPGAANYYSGSSACCSPCHHARPPATHPKPFINPTLGRL